MSMLFVIRNMEERDTTLEAVNKHIASKLLAPPFLSNLRMPFTSYYFIKRTRALDAG
jgi:hypothetical protein